MQKQSQKKPPQKRQASQHSVEKPEKPNKNPVDYQVLLLSLADEYLNSAHRHGTKMALTNRAADIEEYYKLIATGLGCLEAVLKVCPAALHAFLIPSNRPFRTGVCNLARKPWSDYVMHVHYSRRRTMTLRRRQL